MLSIKYKQVNKDIKTNYLDLNHLYLNNGCTNTVQLLLQPSPQTTQENAQKEYKKEGWEGQPNRRFPFPSNE
jgi:hypothetical protein